MTSTVEYRKIWFLDVLPSSLNQSLELADDYYVVIM